MTLERLNEASYAATVAGLAYSLAAVASGGFAVSAAGFSHKLPSLCLRVCGALAETLSAAPADAAALELFDRARQKLTLALSNAGHVAANCAYEGRLTCLEHPHFSPEEQLVALRELRPTDLTAFAASEWSRGVDESNAADVTPPRDGSFLTVVACGNVSSDEALEFYSNARAALRLSEAAAAVPPPSAPSPPSPGPRRSLGSCVVLKPGCGCYRVGSSNASETNNAVELYWQLEPYKFELAAKLDLLVHLMFEPLFDQLRTKEQLGYSVACGARSTQGMLGFCITVTSAVASPRKVEARALRFVARFVKSVGAMRASRYLANVDAAVANKLRDDVNISDESMRLIAEIESEQYVFDRAEREAEQMKGVSQPEMAAWAKRVLIERPRRLSVHAHRGTIQGKPEGVEPLPPGAIGVQSAHDFQRALEVHRRELKPLPSVLVP